VSVGLSIAGLGLAIACGSSEGNSAGAPDASAGTAGAVDSGTGLDGSAGTGGSGGNGGSGGADCGAELPSPTVVDPGAARDLTIVGDPPAALGIFDPSPVYPVNASSGALAYSAVPAGDAIHTRIAVSSDQGASWTFVAAANSASDLTFAIQAGAQRCPGGTCTARLIHEVPSLVEDPSDPDAARRYKLFTHSYAVLPPDELARDLGYISLFTAPGPAGPWVFEAKAVGWRGESELSSQGARMVATDYAQLRDCLALTEPAALHVPGGTLDLALGCAFLDAGRVAIRIELVRSLDHARTFGYAGRLLRAEEAACLGGARNELNAAHLFLHRGNTYLSVSPAGPTSGGSDGYRGCQILSVLTATAAIRRNDAGRPGVLRTLDGPGNRFTGACAYAEGATALGYLVPELMLDQPPRIFRIFASGVAAP
jgi:hypothetical protein